MLTYKINRNSINTDNTLLEVDNSSALTLDDNGNIIIVSEKHGLNVDDTVMFANGGLFLYTNVVDVVDENTFTVKGFTDLSAVITASEILENDCVHVSIDSPHYYVTERDIYVSDYIGDWSGYTNEAKITLRETCDAYVVFDDYYLYGPLTTVDKKYDLDNLGECLNSYGNFYFYDENQERVDIEECTTPVDFDGSDNPYSFIYCGDDEFIREYLDITDAEAIRVVYFKDERFIKELSGDTFTFLEGTELYKANNKLCINVPLASDFNLKSSNDDNESSVVVNDIIENNINPIIDYEKQIFNPVYEKDGKVYDINKIKVQIHLAARDLDWNPMMDEDGNQYWMIYAESGDVYNCSDRLYPENDDDVNTLWFEENDVYYQKKKISKSFIRISIVDTPKVGMQSLLMYSTIFLDAGKLYTDYIRNKAIGSEATGQTRIDATFSCTDKYDMMGCSEGFYLYLFKDEIETEDDEWTYLYMKIDFNNAKFGESIQMSFNENPDGYYTTTSGASFVDMNALFNDMYTKIGIRYNTEKKRYEWCFVIDEEKENVRITDDGEAILTLFEPLTNNYKTDGDGN